MVSTLFKNKFFVLLVLCGFTAEMLADVSNAVVSKKEEIKENSIYRKIASRYLRSFNVAESRDQEKEEDESWNTFNPDLDLGEFSDYESRKIALNMLALTGGEDSLITRETVWRDLDLFCGSGKSYDVHLLSKVDRTSTSFGQSYLTKMLATPSLDIEFLKRRQDIVKELVDNEKLFGALNKQLALLKQSEDTLLSFWSGKDKENAKFINPSLYFNVGPLKNFNKTPGALELMTRLDQLNAGFVALMLPAMRFGVDVFRRMAENKMIGDTKWEKAKNAILNLPWALKDLATLRLERNIVSGLMGKDDPLNLKFYGNMVGNKNIPDGQAGYRMVAFYDAYALFCGGRLAYILGTMQKHNIDMTKYLQIRLIAVADYLRSINRVWEVVKKDKNLRGKLLLSDKMKNLLSRSSGKSEELEKLMSLLSSNTFNGKASIFSLTGKILAAYKLMLSVRDEFIGALEALGEVDAHMSIAKLYKEYQGQRATYSFANYTSDEDPYISLKGLWNPFIDAETVVKNDITLGGENPNNVILTGPNAGGKSTVLKGVTINLLLAQTLGIAPSDSITITPFAKICTYLNINDDIAAGNSLFKAEVLRTQDLLNVVKTLGKNDFCFTIMDEIFSGTSPKEGEAASYAVSKLLGSYENGMCMIATHFPKLTKLEDRTGGLFKNYKVTVVRNSDGTLTYPYKLEEGAADQNIAFDILINEGVIDQSVLAEAQSILNEGAGA